MHAALQRDARVVVPQVLLRGHQLEGLALLLPHLRDVEQHLGLPVALLGLVRLEQEHGRGAEGFASRLVAERLGDDARFLRHVRGERMVEVVRVLERMREHEGGLQRTVDVHQPVDRLRRHAHRVVAEVEELHLAAEQVGGGLGFPAAVGLHALERHSGLAPELRGFAALAEGQAHDLHLPAARGVQRDRAAGAPDEIGGMRAHDERGFLRF